MPFDFCLSVRMSEHDVIDCPVDTVKCDKCLKIYILQSWHKNMMLHDLPCVLYNHTLLTSKQKDKTSPEFEDVCERVFEVRYKREVMLAAQWILSVALRSRCSQGTQGHFTAPGGPSVLRDKRSKITTLRAWQGLLLKNWVKHTHQHILCWTEHK